MKNLLIKKWIMSLNLRDQANHLLWTNKYKSNKKHNK